MSATPEERVVGVVIGGETHAVAGRDEAIGLVAKRDVPRFDFVYADGSRVSTGLLRPLRPGDGDGVMLVPMDDELTIATFDPEPDRAALLSRFALRLFVGAGASSAPPRVDLPRAALRMLPRRDAVHYAREWGAHLFELVADGEHRQARRDRRRMALAVPWLAVELRLRALLTRRLRARQ